MRLTTAQTLQAVAPWMEEKLPLLQGEQGDPSESTPSRSNVPASQKFWHSRLSVDPGSLQKRRNTRQVADPPRETRSPKP